jgi:hypothetical protein
MVQAILTDKPKYSVTNVDIIACSNTMNNLLRFVLGKENPFRILVEVLGKTVFFIRRVNSPTETIPNVHGYGHTFPEAYTTWSARVSGSESHQRVMEYEFAGMQCLVRCEADGFLPDLVPDTEKAEETPVPSNDAIDPEERSSSMEDVLCVPAATTELQIGKSGRHIPQCAVFELKTRAITKINQAVLKQELPRLWISQTPNFILAHHTYGQFNQIRVQDVRDDVKQWEETLQPALGKFASLLQMIVAFVRDTDNKKLEIERKEGEQVLNLRAQGGVVNGVLSPAVASKWDM